MTFNVDACFLASTALDISCDLCRDMLGDEKIGFRILQVKHCREIVEIEFHGIWRVLEKISGCKKKDDPFKILCDNQKAVKVALSEKVDECTVNRKLLSKIWLYDDL